MSSLAVLALIEKLHATPTRCVLHTTGAGGSAIQALLSVAGCSKTLLNATIPYSQQATFQLLDHVPSKLLSADVGRDLAHHAYLEALKLVGNEGRPVVGIGATAAIQTSRQRRGDDAVYVSSWADDAAVTDYSLVMSKDRTRGEQEALVQAVILKALADAAGVPFEVEGLRASGSETDPPEVIEKKSFAASLSKSRVIHPYEVGTDIVSLEPIHWMLEGKVKAVLYNKYGAVRTDRFPFTWEVTPPIRESGCIFLLFPGSFNPLHWGHKELALAGSRLARTRYEKAAKDTPQLPPPRKVQVTFELALSRVGKGTLTPEEAQARVSQFVEIGQRVVLTDAKLFIEKARLFPNHGMIVGYDTMIRILDPVYYNNSSEEMIAALKAISDLGCYFLVAGRVGLDGKPAWRSLKDIHVPEEVSHMVIEIPPEDFRADVSSTEIRAQKAPPSR
jgi:hypothetical protein